MTSSHHDRTQRARRTRTAQTTLVAVSLAGVVGAAGALGAGQLLAQPAGAPTDSQGASVQQPAYRVQVLPARQADGNGDWDEDDEHEGGSGARVRLVPVAPQAPPLASQPSTAVPHATSSGS